MYIIFAVLKVRRIGTTGLESGCDRRKTALLGGKRKDVNANMKKVSLTLAMIMLLSVFSLTISNMSVHATGNNYTVSDMSFENSSMHVGSDESERNFIWHSDSSIGYVDYAVRNGNNFPAEYTSVQTHTSVFNGKTVHRATVFGLKNDTEYVYRFRSGNTVSQPKFFETDPIDHFNFIFVGDPQITPGNIANCSGTWKKTLSTALSMFPETSLLVSAGDQVEESSNAALYTAFLSPEQLSSLAMATTIGNHDYDTNFYKNYFNNPNTEINGKSYGNSAAGSDYWFTYNNVLFMNINTCSTQWDEHKEFMQKAIAANPNVGWKVVVTHYNFFGSNNYFINEQIKERREQFAPIMQELDIDVVLSGHEHVNSRAYMINGLTADVSQGKATSVTDPTGILYLSGGTPSGSKYYKLLSADQLPHIAFNLQNVVTFTNVEVDTNTFRITTYRASDKAVMDTFEIKKVKNAVETDYKNHTHTEADWTDVYAPTYHFEGVRVKRCTYCGAAYEYEFVPKLELEEGNTNIALGKKYTRSGLFLKDGLEKYPDENGTTMTDGKFAADNGVYSDAAYMAFHTGYGDYGTNGYAHITLDLERSYRMDKFVAYTASEYAGAGVTGPSSVSVYVSEDNENWKLAGSAQPKDTTETSMLEIVINSEEVHLARYVQFRFVTSKAFIMVAEVEAHQAQIDEHTHTAGKWVEIQKPTTNRVGISCTYCTFCGDVIETKEIPKLEVPEYGENLVLGKRYERSELFSNDGVEKYADEDGISMTDGIIGADTATYSDKALMAFYAKNAKYLEDGFFHITFDLGEEYELWRFVTYYAASSEHNKGAGVQEPGSIAVYVSSDGENWTRAADRTPDEVTDKGIASTEMLLDAPVTARYVQFRYTHKNTFVMPSEAEVYGVSAVKEESAEVSSEKENESTPSDKSQPADSNEGTSSETVIGIVLIIFSSAVIAAMIVILIKRKK